jgi:hypothetical protein
VAHASSLPHTMSKALSTGTLSLRFMQRGPGAVPAALPQAPVADDGAWAVPQALRAAWAADGAPRCVHCSV